MKELLDQHKEFQEKLFIRGYLISENKSYNLSEYPFYNNWNSAEIGKFAFYTHKTMNAIFHQTENKTLFLIGSCLNPFDGLVDERIILEKLSEKLTKSRDDALEYLSEFTGNFLLGMTDGETMTFLSDPSGMLFGCYGTPGDQLYISSHAQLIDDLCTLEKSEYAREFEEYKYFYKYGLFFPGDTTQYEGITRIIQNHLIHYDGSSFSIERFYPTKELKLVEGEEAYEKLILKVRKILGETMRLAAEKWPNAAISLTGGMDSKTTLACTNGNYNKFHYYSYISMDGDIIDADAAKKISEKIGIPHIVYHISENDSDFPDLDIYKKILVHNNGGYHVNANDVRKRVYFSVEKPFDVEIKSWVSEIARANYYKKFGLKKMPNTLTARNMTAMFKVFTAQRSLAKKTDRIFTDFIEKTKFNKMPSGYDASDMYLWEFRYSAWGGMVITSEHSFSNEIFIPFNNRRLLNLMLTAPKEKRISDQFHEDIITCGDSRIHDLGITITNWNETKKRMYIEKTYFLMSSFFEHL